MPQNPSTNIYDLDYFTGSQMFLYIGDVWVDEVTSLSYVTQQQKTPLYGYASQLFDDTAAGQVIVQGSFTINYKEQGYLWAVLRRYFEIAEDDSLQGNSDSQTSDGKNRDKSLFKKKDEFKRLKNGKVIAGASKSSPLVGSNGTRISRANVERLVSGEAGRQERYNFYDQLAGYATVGVRNAKDKVFEDIVEVFEDQVWNQQSDNILNSQIRRTDDNSFDGFDMYVVFGNYANKGANHTVQKIIDVRLTGQSKMISIDGAPIQEQYEFIARSIA